MTPAYAKQWGFWTREIDVKAQKIDVSSLEIYEIVIVAFQVIDKHGKARFF